MDQTARNDYDLPQSVQEVAKIIRRVRAIAVARTVCWHAPIGRTGGKGRQGSLYVPKMVNDCIVGRVGRESAEKLVAAFPGETLYIPVCHSALSRVRNNLMRTLREGGVSTVVIASAAGMTRRHVGRLCAGVKPAAPKCTASQHGERIAELRALCWQMRAV